ncbi:hypothetical protein D3C71_1160490 [compost metagenome]
MPEAIQPLVLADVLCRHVLIAAPARGCLGHQLLDVACELFAGTPMYVAKHHGAGSDRTLDRYTGCLHKTGDCRGRRNAMVGDRDEHRIDDLRLVALGKLSLVEQVHHGAEVDLADEISEDVVAPHQSTFMWSGVSDSGSPILSIRGRCHSVLQSGRGG